MAVKICFSSPDELVAEIVIFDDWREWSMGMLSILALLRCRSKQ